MQKFCLRDSVNYMSHDWGFNHGWKPVRTVGKRDWVRTYILVDREPLRGKHVCSAAPPLARRPVADSGADVKARFPLPDAQRKNVSIVHEDACRKVNPLRWPSRGERCRPQLQEARTGLVCFAVSAQISTTSLMYALDQRQTLERIK